MVRKKIHIARAIARSGKFPIPAIAKVLQVARSNLIEKTKKRSQAYQKPDDQNLLYRISQIIQEKPAYGYRRVTAVVRGQLKQEGCAVVNHKRIYRLMNRNGLLLQKPLHRPKRAHDRKVETLMSNMRWCSDSFSIQCANGEKVIDSGRQNLILEKKQMILLKLFCMNVLRAQGRKNGTF